MVKFEIFVAVTMIGISMGQDQCGVCMEENKASCESETSYMMCVGKK